MAASYPKKQNRQRLFVNTPSRGLRHLDHLAQLRKSQTNSGMLDLFSFQLSGSLGTAEGESARSWTAGWLNMETARRGFMTSLGENSFIGNWAGQARS